MKLLIENCRIREFESGLVEQFLDILDQCQSRVNFFDLSGFFCICHGERGNKATFIQTIRVATAQGKQGIWFLQWS